MPDPILFELDDGGIATVTFNRPERLNALSLDFQHALRDVLARVHEDRRVRVLMLTGAGRAYCAGADLVGGLFDDDGSGRSRGQRTAEAMHALTNPLIAGLRTLPVPVLAAVNGVVAGADDQPGSGRTLPRRWA